MDGAIVRAVPLWLLRAYLEDLGGQAQANGGVAGEGWQARLTQLADAEVGSLRLGQVRLELSGDEAAVARLQAALRPKLLRAGG